MMTLIVIESIVCLIDVSGDHRIEFEEFVNFLESGHPKAGSSIPTPIECLRIATTFS